MAEASLCDGHETRILRLESSVQVIVGEIGGMKVKLDDACLKMDDSAEKILGKLEEVGRKAETAKVMAETERALAKARSQWSAWFRKASLPGAMALIGFAVRHWGEHALRLVLR